MKSFKAIIGRAAYFTLGMVLASRCTKEQVHIVEVPKEVIVEKEVVVEVVKEKVINKTITKYVEVCRSIDHPIHVFPITPVVINNAHKHTVSMMLGRGPIRMSHSTSGSSTSVEIDQGLLLGLGYRYQVNERWSFTAEGLSNSSGLGGVGYSFK